MSKPNRKEPNENPSLRYLELSNGATGFKNDSDKPRVDLLPSIPLLGVARVLGIGARKYSAHNWRGGIQFSRLYAAALRHLLAFNDGEDLDRESGLNHLDHALCELMFLRELFETRKDLDDRYKR